MTGGLRIEHYDWAGGREAMLRFGPDEPRVIVSLPLFEEANRTRAFAVTLLHALAARDIGGLLPDWPGHGREHRSYPRCDAGRDAGGVSAPCRR